MSTGVAGTLPRPAATVDPDRLAAAYAHCLRVARGHYENFTIGSWLLPRRLRKDLAAVYAFARGADDIADEGPDAGRLERLAAWEAELVACAAHAAAARDPIFLALGDTIARHRLDVGTLRDLLHAFRRDASGDTRRFATSTAAARRIPSAVPCWPSSTTAMRSARCVRTTSARRSSSRTSGRTSTAI